MNPSIRQARARWLAAATGILLAACAGPYSTTQAIDPRHVLSLSDGMRLLARAMQAVGYFPTQQSDAQGQVIGERNDKDAFGTDVLTLTIDARLRPSAAGRLQMDATCSVSKNIVYTDQLDDECEKFRRAFDKLLSEREVGGRLSAPPAERIVRDPRVAAPPAAASAPATAAPSGYSL